MGKRFLIIALLLVVALCAYVGYNRYDARRAGVNGDVFSSDPPSHSANPPSPTSSQAVLSAEPAPRQPEPSPNTQLSQSTPGAPPTTDTISPNPPNGMVFSGSGRFQVYRQGDLTWRIDTESGDSCILFATDEEWKKPKVYRNGCRGR